MVGAPLDRKVSTTPGRGQNIGMTPGGSGKSQRFWLAREDYSQDPISLRVTSNHPLSIFHNPHTLNPSPTASLPRGRERASAPSSFIFYSRASFPPSTTWPLEFESHSDPGQLKGPVLCQGEAENSRMEFSTHAQCNSFSPPPFYGVTFKN